jgi:leader peptidase (prepilin peptidase) / N-methyltransferase
MHAEPSISAAGIATGACVFLFGAVWGSFFYTLALRYADGTMERGPIRALFSSSRCDSCSEKISALHLVPVAGYLLLRGRCARCGARISPLYPFAEVLYGLLALLFAHRFGPGVMTANLFLISGLAACIAVIDMKTLTIPDSLVVVFTLLSVYPVTQGYTLSTHLYGMLAMALFFLVLLLIFPGSFGGGDVKLAAAAGLLAGLEQSVVVLEVALVTGSIAGTVYALASGKGLRIKIAFGPFIAAGIIVSLLYGDVLVLLYRRFAF